MPVLSRYPRLITTITVYPAAFLALAIWAGTTISNKYAVQSMDPLSVALLRAVLAASILLPFLLRFAERPRGSIEWLQTTMCGATNFLAWPVLLSLGLARTSATHAALIVSLIPLATVSITSIAERRLPNGRWLLGAALALAGTAYLILDKGTVSEPDGPVSTIAGDSLILIGCIVCGCGYVISARLARRLGVGVSVGWSIVVPLPVAFAGLIFVAPNVEWQNINLETWLAIAWLSILSTIVGYLLWIFALKKGGVSRVGSLQLALPVLTLLGATLVLDETIPIEIGLIALVVVTGTAISHLSVRE